MTKIVGILNITPDSFSDGSRFLNVDSALLQLKKIINEGADIIDVGAESTRPGSVPIDADEEINRLKDIIPKIIQTIRQKEDQLGRKIELSLDSYHFKTIKWAFQLGFDILNDVSGLKDEKIIDFVAKNNLKTVFMHSKDIICDENLVFNSEIDIVDQILDWAAEKIEDLTQKGIKKSQLIFDPGVGFNKNSWQSIRVLKNASRFKNLGLEVYVGHSKKRFLDEVYRAKNVDFIDGLLGEIKSSIQTLNILPQSLKSDKYWREKSENKNDILQLRAKKTLLVSKFLINKNIDYLRVHDVKEHTKLIAL